MMALLRKAFPMAACVALLGLCAAASPTWAQDKPKAEPAKPKVEEKGAKEDAKPAKTGEKLPTGEQIMEKYIEALGGKAAMEKHHSRIDKGAFEVVGQNIKGTMTSYLQAPDKLYVVMEGAGKDETGVSSGVAWNLSSAMGPRVLEGEERAILLREATFNAELKWRELYKSVEVVGTETVADHPTYKVVMTGKEGAPETAYFDQKSFLLLKKTLVLKGPQGEVPIDVLLEDYKKVGDILVAQKATQIVGGGVAKQVFTTTSVEFDPEIPADRFAIPQAIMDVLSKSKADKPATPGPEAKPEPKPAKP